MSIIADPQIHPTHTLACALLLMLCIFDAAAASNSVAGTCAKFQAYESSPGVTDDYGANHPGKSGWTTPHFLSTNLVAVPKVAVPKGLPGIGGAPAKCSTVRVSVKFQAAPVISLLTWQPQPQACNECSCNFELSTWQDQLKKHEERHAADFRRLASNAGWRAREFTACGLTPRAKQKALRSQVQRALDKALSDLNAAADQSIDAFHSSIDSVVTPPNCAACAGCNAGQTPALCSGPGCSQCVAGTCLPMQCSPRGSICCGNQCCGFSQAQQPIACCTVGGKPTCSPLGTSACP
jgi:hypothetical protein